MVKRPNSQINPLEAFINHGCLEKTQSEQQRKNLNDHRTPHLLFLEKKYLTHARRLQ